MVVMAAIQNKQRRKEQRRSCRSGMELYASFEGCIYRRVLLFAVLVGLMLVSTVRGSVAQSTAAAVTSSAQRESRESLEKVRDLVTDYFTNGEGAGQMLHRLERLCDTYGPRLAGSAILEEAIDAQAAKMREEGFNVTLTDAMIPKWVRGSESLTLVSPRIGNATTPLALIGLGFSGSTGPEGVQASLLIVPSLSSLTTMLEGDPDAIRGRIVLVNEKYEVGGYGATVGTRYAAPGIVKEAGGLAVLVRNVAPFGVRSPHTGQTTRGVNLPAASIAISDAMRLQRLYDRGEDVMLHLVLDGHEDMGDVSSRNIVADWEGASRPDEYVVLSGHFDSWDVGCGVLDDASGAFLGWSALSALQHIHQIAGLPRPARTVRTILWTCEEMGAQGADAFWKQALADGSIDKYSIAFESDSGVFEPRGIGLSANDEATRIVREIVTDVIGMEVHSRPGSGGSDVASALAWSGAPTGNLQSDEVACFTNEKSVNIPSENDPSGHFQGDYFFYHHSEGDTPEVLDSGQLDRAAAMWTIVAFGIADLPELLPRIDTSADASACALACASADEQSGLTCLTECLASRIMPTVRREHLSSGVYPLPDADADATQEEKEKEAEEEEEERVIEGAEEEEQLEEKAEEDSAEVSGGSSITATGIFVGLLVGLLLLAAFIVTIGLSSKGVSIPLGIAYVTVSSDRVKTNRMNGSDYSTVSMLDLPPDLHASERE